MSLLIAIAIAWSTADRLTPVAMHDDDIISQIHLEAVLRKHGYTNYESGGGDFGNTCILLNDAPRTFFSILHSEAPEDRFSLYSYQKRDFSDVIPDDKWIALRQDQLTGKMPSPIPVTDLIKFVHLNLRQIRSIKFFPRPYSGLDGRHHVGFEITIFGAKNSAAFDHPEASLVDISPAGWRIRCQVYDSDGKQKIVRRYFRMGM
jgi:hypothetical protein